MNTGILEVAQRTGSRILVSSVLVALLTGCGPDGNRTRAEGAAAGAAIGAVAGLLLGDSEGALIGAAIGGAAGLLYGDHVASKKADYAKQEDYYRDVLLAADERVKDARQQNAGLRAEIARLDSALRTTESRYRRSQDRRHALAQQRTEAERLIRRTNSLIDVVDAEIKIQQDVLAQADSSAPQDYREAAPQKVGTLAREKQNLERSLQRLEALDERMAY